MISNPPITDSVRQQARERPGGWVYAVDPEFDPMGNVPPYGIVGAWQVDGQGEITGEFKPNPKYRPSARALEWRPAASPLEAVLQGVATGRRSDEQLIAAFANETVFTYGRPEGGLYVAAPEQGEPMIYAFTDPELLQMTGHSESAPMRGSQLARAAPEGVSILLNPGHTPFARIDPKRVPDLTQRDETS